MYNDRLHYLGNVSQDEFKLSGYQEVYSSDRRMSYDTADLDKDGLMDVISIDANRVIIHKQVSNLVFEKVDQY